MQPIKNLFSKLILLFIMAWLAGCARPLIMDADTGRDDALALLGAMKDCRLLAVVASYGNVPRDMAARNANNLVALGEQVYNCQTDQPTSVWAGESATNANAPDTSTDEIKRRACINGNGLCGYYAGLPKNPSPIKSSADHSLKWPDDFVKLIENHGSVDYIVTGPLTNLAQLIDAFGMDANENYKILDHIDQLIVVGGFLDLNNDELGMPDFNFRADPQAANKVLTVFRSRLLLVPRDTSKLFVLEANDSLLKDKAPVNTHAAANFSRTLLQKCLGFADMPTKQVFLHDPVSLLALDGELTRQYKNIRICQTADKSEQCIGKIPGKTVLDEADGVPVLWAEADVTESLRLRNLMLERYLDLKP